MKHKNDLFANSISNITSPSTLLGNNSRKTTATIENKLLEQISSTRQLTTVGDLSTTAGISSSAKVIRASHQIQVSQSKVNIGASGGRFNP